jgi:predicted acylesterase/phospholipase RssA
MWEWDYISGNSAGALNAMGIGLFEKGQEVAMAKALTEMWENIKGDSTIFTLNPFPESLFDYSSIASNKPLRDYVTSVIK